MTIRKAVTFLLRHARLQGAMLVLGLNPEEANLLQQGLSGALWEGDDGSADRSPDVDLCERVARLQERLTPATLWRE